ncbi:MAG: hypothetical protein QM756_28615 [Polyangiaceae bacterium]
MSDQTTRPELLRALCALALLAAACGCARGAPARERSRDVADAAVPSEAAAALPALPAFLRPVESLRCPAEFPRGYQFVGAEAETPELLRAVWLDGRTHDGVALSATSALAVEARCIAVGPHRDLNLASWCCRVLRKPSAPGSP